MRLLAKAHRFDAARGSASTFADRVVRTAIAMILRDGGRLKRGPGVKTRSLERTRVRAVEGITSLRDAIGPDDLGRRTGCAGHGQDPTDAVHKAVRGLPPELRRVCERIMDGTPASAARDLGISRRQVRSAMEKIRSHFESAGLEDF